MHNQEKKEAGISRHRGRSEAGQESRANTVVSRQWFKMDGGIEGRRKVSGAEAAAKVQEDRRNKIAASTA